MFWSLFWYQLIHMGYQFFIVSLLFAMTCGCNRQLTNQINKENEFSVYTIVTYDSSMYKPNPFWTINPDIEIIYNNLFGLESSIEKINENGQYKIFISRPTFAWCQQINMPLLLYPRDNVAIIMNDAGDIRFQGSNANRTSEIERFTYFSELVKDKIYFTYQPLLKEINIKLSEHSFVHIEEELCKIDIGFKLWFDSLTSNKDFTVQVNKQFSYYLAAAIFKEKIDFLWQLKKHPDFSAFFYSYCKKLVFDVNQIKSHLELEFYYNSLRDLLGLIAYHKEGTSRVFDLPSMRLFLSLIDENFNGLVRQFLLADVLYTGLKNKILSSEVLYKYYLQKLNDNIYKTLVKILARNNTEFESYLIAEERKFILPFNKNASVSEDDLFRLYKGKLVLVDFWASWCTPCRREIPLMRELKRRYLNQDIVFLTVSIDEHISKWRKIAEVEKLIDDQSFILQKSDSAYYFKGLRIDEIPRYLLFDRKGNLISSNAPSPGSHRLIELIDSTLNAD